jgi:hypothetical protein
MHTINQLTSVTHSNPGIFGSARACNFVTLRSGVSTFVIWKSVAGAKSVHGEVSFMYCSSTPGPNFLLLDCYKVVKDGRFSPRMRVFIFR